MGKRLIMLVDDDESIRESLAELLEQEGLCNCAGLQRERGA